MALRRFALLLLAAVAAVVPAAMAAAASPTGCPAAPVQALPLPRLADAVRAGRTATIVALGSSSTQGAGASTPDAAYPARLEAALRRGGVAVRVVNRGRGGEDVVEMLMRLEADVLAERPDVVIWQVGTNAAMRNHPLDRFTLLLREGVRELQAAGADVVLMDSQQGPWAARAPMRDTFDRALADMAVEKGIPLFSRRRLMDVWAAAGTVPEAMLVQDGLHHNDRGYACLAEAVARGMRAALPGR
ncbi:SGNH/GDSL hydrolase family protein [Roseomonas sp. CCTCC AB2023176]|uniref:SGNH/GDSL hydrolase family protein n=1 Tax=Roseomonas sp. CCTCC AB2023176 TaxID=3342640 RepID=UPI0035DA8D82